MSDDEFDLDFVNSATNAVMSKWTKGNVGKDKSKDLKDVTNLDNESSQDVKRKKKKKSDNFIDSPAVTVMDAAKCLNSDEDDNSENEDDLVKNKIPSTEPISITPPGSPTGSPVKDVKIRGAKRTKKTEQALKKIQKAQFASSLKRSVNLDAVHDMHSFNPGSYMRQSSETNSFEVKVIWKADIIRVEVNCFDKMAKVIDQIAEKAKVQSKDLRLYKDQSSLEPIARDNTVRGLGLSIVSVLHARERVANVVEAGEEAEDDSIELKLQTKDRKVQPVTIKIEPTDKMEKVMEMFCASSGMVRAKLKFYFDGEQLQPGESAEDLELEGGECIDVHVSDK